MRALIAVAALGGAALFTAGCGHATVPAAHRAAPAARPSTAVNLKPDPKARAVCDDLRNGVLDVDTKAFGTELGRIIAARTQSDRAGESRATQAAAAKLGEIAGKLRTRAGEATDPRFASALNGSAGNLEKLGSDAGAFAGLISMDAVGQITAKFATGLGDVADYCAA